jgi:hypothetical protein
VAVLEPHAVHEMAEDFTTAPASQTCVRHIFSLCGLHVVRGSQKYSEQRKLNRNEGFPETEQLSSLTAT